MEKEAGRGPVRKGSKAIVRSLGFVSHQVEATVECL